MEKKEYQQLVKSTTPQPRKLCHSILSFLTGGLIGAICETIKALLVNYYNIPKDIATSLIILSLIFIACFWTSFLDFDRWVMKLKAGLIIPITGFAHSINSAALDYKKDGMITGLGSNFFKLAGSVLLYGIISAFIFCILKVIFYG